jgi:predicted metal-binding protein
MRLVSRSLRNSARDQDCTLRLACCNNDPATTVLAHLPVGQGGMGMKNPDIFGVFACSSCHDAIDGRTSYHFEFEDLLRALAETQIKWVEMGLLKIEGVKS